MADYGNLDPMGVDESSVIERIAVNRRICELESVLALMATDVQEARRCAEQWRDNATLQGAVTVPLPWEDL